MLSVQLFFSQKFKDLILFFLVAIAAGNSLFLFGGNFFSPAACKIFFGNGIVQAMEKCYKYGLKKKKTYPACYVVFLG